MLIIQQINNRFNAHMNSSTEQKHEAAYLQ